MIHRHLLLIGIILVLVISAFMRWAWIQVAFDNVEKTAMAKLATVEQVKAKAYLPVVKVAGPDGDLVSVPDKKHYMLVNLWSIRSRESTENVRLLARLKYFLLRYTNDWQVISVSVDRPQDLGVLTRFLKRLELTEAAGYYDARGALYKTVAPKTLPVTLIIDDHGRILYEVYGSPPWFDEDVINFLRVLPGVKFE